MRRGIESLSPLTLAGLAFGISLGLVTGVGGYTFYYAKGASYLGNDPATCANCHIMREHYDAWAKSSHHAVATCNECHTPPGLVHKYLVKADNGFRHSLAFTTGRFPEPLRIKPHNRAVVEEGCRKCHQAVVRAMDGPHRRKEPALCVRCHRDVGHLH